MTHSDQSICQLTQNVNTLAAVATNESRYLSIEKSFRGAVVTFVFLTMMVFYIGLNMIPTVQAAEPTEQQWGDIVTALKDIAKAQTEIAQTQKEIANVMTSMTAENSPFSVLLTRMKEGSDMMRCYLGGLLAGTPETPCGPQAIQKGLGLAMFLMALEKASKDSYQPEPTNKPVGPIEALANMLVLINRVKQDSDTVRIDNKIPAGSGLITSSIHDDLVLIHKVLAAVPHMANEMHIMNMYMSVMSRDMDSTMGRMGRMMPGGWW